MNELRTYSIEGIEYTLYRAASGDFCVSISKYDGDREDYNLGSYAEALEFILSGSIVETKEG